MTRGGIKIGLILRQRCNAKTSDCSDTHKRVTSGNKYQGPKLDALREEDSIRCDDLPNSFEEGIIRTRKSNNYHTRYRKETKILH